jgi:hypothetical protein
VGCDEQLEGFRKVHVRFHGDPGPAGRDIFDVQEIIASGPSTIFAGWWVENRLACRRSSVAVLRAMAATLRAEDR